MIRVTVRDLADAESKDSVVELDNDYVIVCAGTCHVATTQVYGRGRTHVLTVKGRADGRRERKI